MRIEKADCLRNLANRKTFFAIAAKAMRQVLIDHHRRRNKRLEEHVAREPLDDIIDEIEAQTGSNFDFISVELERLEREAPRQHAMIMHRYFCGRTVAETSELLGVSEETVHRDWRLARAKLFTRLKSAE